MTTKRIVPAAVLTGLLATLAWIPSTQAASLPASASGNLGIWLKPDGLTAGALSTWVDSAPGVGGANNAVTTSGSPTVGVSTLNGYNMVHFDGSDDGMLGSLTSLPFNGIDAFIVARVNSGTGVNRGIVTMNDGSQVDYGSGNTAIIWGSGYNGNNGQPTGGDSRWRGDIGNTHGIANVVASLDQVHLYNFSVDTTVTGTVLVDGSLSQSLGYGSEFIPTSTATLSTSAASAPTQFAIGGRLSPNLQEFANVDIAEIIIYDRALTATERAEVNSYIAEKYALLPEPASLGLLGVGGVMLARRRKA